MCDGDLQSGCCPTVLEAVVDCPFIIRDMLGCKASGVSKISIVADLVVLNRRKCGRTNLLVSM